jgi:soluble lytic murein transglycosylase-like protein
MRYFLAFIVVLISTIPASASDAHNYVVASAAKHGVSKAFALRVAKIESGVQCGRVGRAGERGPLQILPATARGLGYKNIRGASCRTQTDAGMKHLAICYHGARGNWFRAAACHNAGFAALKWRKYPAGVKGYARKIAR